MWDDQEYAFDVEVSDADSVAGVEFRPGTPPLSGTEPEYGVKPMRGTDRGTEPEYGVKPVGSSDR
eukprot:16022588-Heterocapsa_arctica.AAC.1